MKLKYKKTNKNSIAPTKGTLGAAAWDLYSIEEGVVRIEGVSTFDTGIAMEIPEGHVGLVFGRSGMAFKESAQLANAVAVIDEDFRGSIKVGLVKHDTELTFVKKGDRIAQIMFIPLPKIELEESSELSVTKRGEAGLGSTGKGLSVQEAIEKL